MAEAHSAVAFSFTISHEGWDVNFDREVLNIVWSSGVRSWKKRLARFKGWREVRGFTRDLVYKFRAKWKNSVKNGVYPASIQSYWITVSIIAGFHFAGMHMPGGLLERVLPKLPNKALQWEILACCFVGFFWWILCIYAIRYLLKFMLMYKGWMYEERGKGRSISLTTKLWLVGVKLLTAFGRPQLYSYQGALPRLSVPPLGETLQRYLRSVRPLLSDERYARMERLAKEFENGLGKKCQRYLVLKSWWASNYVSDWWEEFVYLRGRTPLVINSNFYGIDAILKEDTPTQAARAASIIHTLLLFRRVIDRQELQPILVQGLVPLCSAQYERVFNTTRVPGIETDKIVHWADSNHIVVYHKGRYFKVVIYHNKRILNPCEIEIQIRQILENNSPPAPGEEKLAALTGGSRVHWAQTRQALFFKGPNRQALDLVEKAAFVVCLDDVPYEWDCTRPELLDRYGITLFHGKGYDRWFDKSFTLCIGSNGRVGFNAEHSWADAAVMSHLWEWVFVEEFSNPNLRADAPVMSHAWEYFIGWEMEDARYTENGHCTGVPEFLPPAPVRLHWDLTEPYLKAIDISYQEILKLISDIDLRILYFDKYGKGFMKDCRISPDAYIQMALQLAYYRDTGKFSLTYEASMTRLFREGRTETVRPCTIESSAWVRAMVNPKSTLEERISLLDKAVKVHQTGYQDAMCGKGIDRHLFCLYVISKYLEVDSPFLKEVLSEPWRLSTSQTPHGQTSKLDLKKYPTCISAGGGFGPVADDGYGVSYIIAGENILFFHISSKLSSPETNSSRLAVRVEEALHDMKKMFIEYRNQRVPLTNGESAKTK